MDWAGSWNGETNVIFRGCYRKCGALSLLKIIKFSLLLVTLPPPLLTTTEKRAPLSAAVVAGVV